MVCRKPDIRARRPARISNPVITEKVVMTNVATIMPTHAESPGNAARAATSGRVTLGSLKHHGTFGPVGFHPMAVPRGIGQVAELGK